MARSRHIFALLLTLILLVQCATAPDQEAPEFAVEGDADSALAVALRTSARVDDIFSRVLLHTRIAEVYNEVGLLLPASEVLSGAVELARSERAGAARAEILVQVAVRYQEIDLTDRSRALLREALDLAREIEDERVRVVVLQEVANASFIAGEELFDILIDALNQIYIVGDLRARVGLLVDVARQYQESGLGQQVDTLVQHAISAATAIENPWQKAAAYSSIAHRFAVAGNEDQSELFVRRALREIVGVEVLARSASEAAELLTVADNLAAIGRFEEAERVLATIEFPVIRARGLAELGSRHLVEERYDEADRLFDDAVNVVAAEGTEAQFTEIVSDVADRLAGAGRFDTATANAEIALFIVDDVADDFTRIRILQRLASVFIQVDRIDLAVEAAEALPDSDQRALLFVSLSKELLDLQQPDDAVRFVAPAQRAADDVDAGSDEVFLELATLYSRIGRYADAIEQIDRVESAFTRGLALVQLGRYSLLAGGLTDEERDRVADLNPGR